MGLAQAYLQDLCCTCVDDHSVVDLVPSVWKVAGSNPTLAATEGPWASPSLAVACSALACKLRHSINAIVGSASKWLMLRERYRNG